MSTKTINRKTALVLLEDWYQAYFATWDAKELLEQMVAGQIHGVTGFKQMTDHELELELLNQASCTCEKGPIWFNEQDRCKECGSYAFEYKIKK